MAHSSSELAGESNTTKTNDQALHDYRSGSPWIANGSSNDRHTEFLERVLYILGNAIADGSIDPFHMPFYIWFRNWSEKLRTIDESLFEHQAMQYVYADSAVAKPTAFLHNYAIVWEQILSSCPAGTDSTSIATTILLTCYKPLISLLHSPQLIIPFAPVWLDYNSLYIYLPLTMSPDGMNLPTTADCQRHQWARCYCHRWFYFRRS